MHRGNLRLLGAYYDKLFVGPSHVSIHVNSGCNFNCLFCWSHSPLVKGFREKKGMGFQKFKGLIDDCNSMGVNQISILGEGEPTLHPRICDMISYIKKKGMRLTLDTNCSFDISKLKNIFDVDILRINFSAATPDKYRKIHFQKSNSMFYGVLKNIGHISEVRKRLRLKSPALHIVYIINKENFEDIGKMIELCSPFDIDCMVFKLMQATDDTMPVAISHEDKPKLKRVIEDSLKKRGIKFITNLREIRRILNHIDFLPANRKSVKKVNDRFFYFTPSLKKNMRCYIGWYQIKIDRNGDVFSCCDHQKFQIGNIYEDTLKNIWNSKKFHEVRMKYKYNIDLKKKLWAECRYCPMIQFNKDIESRIKRIRNKNF